MRYVNLCLLPIIISIYYIFSIIFKKDKLYIYRFLLISAIIFPSLYIMEKNNFKYISLIIGFGSIIYVTGISKYLFYLILLKKNYKNKKNKQKEIKSEIIMDKLRYQEIIMLIPLAIVYLYLFDLFIFGCITGLVFLIYKKFAKKHSYEE